MAYLRRLYLSPRGRIGRWAFNVYLVVPCVLLGLASGVLSVVAPGLALGILVAVLILLVWPSIAMSVKRLQDLNIPRSWVICMVLLPPIISFLPINGARLLGQVFTLLVAILLIFVPGTKGPNRYGEKP